MTDRSATDTIVGCFYQFDKTILDILNSNNEQTIVVEGIEDIDLISPDETIAVQCKYYEKSEYNHSVIKKPLMLMLKHYADLFHSGSPIIKYHLYGHYKSGQEKLSLPITIDYLKTNFLTYTRKEPVVTNGIKTTKKITHKLYEELGLSDDNLSDFIKLLTIDIKAPTFENQFNEIIYKLCEHFNCDKFEAENFYYNSGLKGIKDLSTKQDENKRGINRLDFLRLIDTKKILFNSWYVRFKG